jgi:hypothetical protein
MRFACVLALMTGLIACSATIAGGTYEEDGSASSLSAGVPTLTSEDATVISVLRRTRPRDPLDGSTATDQPLPMDQALQPTVSLYIQHFAIPRSTLPSGGHDLAVLRFGLHARGGAVRVPPVFLQVEALAGRLTNETGTDQFMQIEWRDLSDRNTLVAGLSRVPVARVDDRQSAPASLTSSLVIQDDETTFFTLNVHTSAEEALFREDPFVPARYRFTLGNGETFFPLDVIRAINGREIVVASNQSLAETVTILPVGHPIVRPTPCATTFEPGEQAFLCGRMASSGAPVALKRLMFAYAVGGSAHPRLWHWTSEWILEWDGERLLTDFVEVLPANDRVTEDAGEISLRFRHETMLDETGVAFTLYRRTEGRMEAGEQVAAQLLTGAEEGTHPLARLGAMDQQAFNGWLAPNLWIHATDPCRPLPLCTGPSCRDFTDRVRVGWSVWSPMLDGAHSDDPCGLIDWYGTMAGMSLRNVVVAP